MKGPAPIEIPSFFTVEWYRVQKELRKTDPEIANELFISLPLLNKWKKKIGWKTEQIYKLMCGRKKTLDPFEIRRLKEQGLSNVEIAKHYGVTASAIWYSLKSIEDKCSERKEEIKGQRKLRKMYKNLEQYAVELDENLKANFHVPITRYGNSANIRAKAKY